MSNSYDDAKFGVIERTWISGLTQKWGGSHTVITTNETQSVPTVKRTYFKGPIEIVKLGVAVLATMGKGEQLFGLCVNGTATVKGTVVASSQGTPYTVASKVFTNNPTVAAGSYLTLLASTNVCSTGSYAVFVDWRRKFTAGNSDKW